MSDTPETSGAVVTPARVVIALCLVAPFVAMLWVGSFAKVDPAFIGIPFFYWYQMLWVVISTALTMTAYQLWKRDQRDRTASRGAGEGTAGAAGISDGGASL
jgi:membrane protein implicated in regulation of membrane protease activity